MEQIYITEDNIVKYDDIAICQIGLPDKEVTVKYEDMSILSSSIRNKIE